MPSLATTGLRRALTLLLLLTATVIGCAPAQSSGHRTAKAAPHDSQGDGQKWTALGDGHMSNGDPSRAAQYYEAGYREGTAALLPKLLTACIASRQYALAIEHAEAAVARDPTNAHLRGLLGALHASMGELDKARQHFELAASDRPLDATMQFTVGVFFRDDAREPGRADSYFRAYLAIAPKGAHAIEAQASLMKRVE